MYFIFCLIELRARVHVYACVCACMRASVRRVCVCVCVYACACARPCKNVKNPQKNAKKYTPPCEKKIVFCLLRAHVICIYSPFATHTYRKFLLHLTYDNRDKRTGVGWPSGRFQRIPPRRKPTIYGVYTAFIVD